MVNSSPFKGDIYFSQYYEKCVKCVLKVDKKKSQ